MNIFHKARHDWCENSRAAQNPLHRSSNHVNWPKVFSNHVCMLAYFTADLAAADLLALPLC